MPTTLCPTCQRPVEWSEQFPWRPFCSERCKMVDFGAWITERHVIPSDSAEEPTDFDNEDDLDER